MICTVMGMLFLVLAGLLFALLMPSLHIASAASGTIFLIGAVIIVCACHSNARFTLEFTGDKLHITGVRKNQTLDLSGLKADDFRFSQTAAQVARNEGTLGIKDVVFNYYFVKNFDELKKYIAENFSSDENVLL